jgi:hypothetical protein
MINEVVLEGIVVKTWKYADDLLFRIACYRDPDLPSKSLNDVRDAVALAAAAEISQRVFEETGDLQPTSRTWPMPKLLPI